MKTYIFVVLLFSGMLFNSCSEKKEVDPDLVQDILNNIYNVVPKEAVDNFRASGMSVIIGGEPINIRGIIYSEIMEVNYAFDSKLKLGDKMEPYLFGITRQDINNEVRLMLGPHRELGHRMSGDGIVSSSNGKDFTIFVKTNGLGPRGRSEYTKLWLISGVLEGNVVKDLEYAYFVERNEGVSIVDNLGARIIVEKKEGRWSPS